MHSHKELDVISVMIEGEIHHKGSLEHGTSLSAGQVQVQRAGGKGFAHNEINPNPLTNRMLQLWVVPENKGGKTDYKVYDIAQDTLTTIYGGSKEQNTTLDSHTIIEVGRFSKDESITKSGDFLAYITEGEAIVNEIAVKDGDLIRGVDMHFTATSDKTHIILITQNSQHLQP
jgi:redox-sensitive bicupin YhaK (pirin superfamily)